MKSKLTPEQRQIIEKILANPPTQRQQQFRQLWVNGTGTIEGIGFDLKPNELSMRGWEPEEYVQSFLLDPERLIYPWHADDSAVPPGGLRLSVGDRVVARITELEVGDDLDHPADRHKRIVSFAVERSGTEIPVSGSISYRQRGTFSGHMDADYADVIRRLNELLVATGEPAFNSCMGNTRSSDIASDQASWDQFMNSFEAPSGAEGHDKKDIAFARRAVLAAARVDFHWIYIRYFLNKDPLKFDHADFVSITLQQAINLVNTASSVGYWLAKCEFAPHRDDTKEGKKSKDARKRGGKTRRDQIVQRAARWRAPALAFALKERSKPNSKFGQKALAKEILQQQFMLDLLSGPEGKLPETDTIISAIKSWEDEGLLPVSAHKRALGTGGIKQAK